MDGTKTRTSGGKTLSSGGTAPLKPKPGLSGPPVRPPKIKCATVAAELALGLDGRDARPHTNRIILTRTPSFMVIAAMNRCATQNQVQHRAGQKKQIPPLRWGCARMGRSAG